MTEHRWWRMKKIIQPFLSQVHAAVCAALPAFSRRDQLHQLIYYDQQIHRSHLRSSVCPLQPHETAFFYPISSSSSPQVVEEFFQALPSSFQHFDQPVCKIKGKGRIKTIFNLCTRFHTFMMRGCWPIHVWATILMYFKLITLLNIYLSSNFFHILQQQFCHKTVASKLWSVVADQWC